jgi:capsular polysaccharide biosynthesis protein
MGKKVEVEEKVEKNRGRWVCNFCGEKFDDYWQFNDHQCEDDPTDARRARG